MAGDLLSVIEAAYNADAPDPEWLGGILQAAEPLFNRGLGVAIYSYDHRGPEPMMRSLQVGGGFNPAWLPRYRARMGNEPDSISPPDWRRWFHQTCGTAHTTPNLDQLIRALEEFGGARDVFGINGRDPESFGVFFAAPSPGVVKLSKKQLELYARVAPHFAAGFRLRRRLSGEKLTTDGAEAVLKPGGELVHAERDAREKAARDELVRAVKQIDRARTSKGRKDLDAATRSWRGLVDARWTLVDCFEHGSDRFVVAKRNDIDLADPPPLSARERQVLAFAAIDHTNKEIAYELGLSAATVRVLMARAARKLRANGRADAIARYRELVKPR